jgi:hypothetical protein
MRLHVSRTDAGSGEWRGVATVEGIEESAFGITSLSYDAALRLPDGEELLLRGRYDPIHRGIQLTVFSGGRQVADLGGFRSPLDGFDPALGFRTPGDYYLQVLLGP